MVLYRMPIMILILGLVYIFISPEDPITFKIFFRILPLTAIIYYVFQIAPREKSFVHWLIISGLILSVPADAIVHWSVSGLIVFLAVHLCYALGFFSLGKFTILWGLAGIPIAAYAVLFSRQLIPAIESGTGEVSVVPVIAYVIALSVMLWAACSSGNLPAIFGALLFVVSHSIYLWYLFVEPMEHAKVIVMLSYYAAQYFVALSLYTIVKESRQIVW